jgi:hypothetical protein
MWKVLYEYWHQDSLGSNFLTKIHFSNIVHRMMLLIDNNDIAAVARVMDDTSVSVQMT